MKSKGIIKKCLLVMLTACLTLLILQLLFLAGMWYVPLRMVDNPHTLEDYFLWWFSLDAAVFMFPLWFFAARKTIRLFRNNPRWLTVSAAISRKVTAPAALALAGLLAWQIGEYHLTISGISSYDVPEHAQAMAAGYQGRAMICAVALWYTLCLLLKQIRAKREQ